MTENHTLLATLGPQFKRNLLLYGPAVIVVLVALLAFCFAVLQVRSFATALHFARALLTHPLALLQFVFARGVLNIRRSRGAALNELLERTAWAHTLAERVFGQRSAEAGELLFMLGRFHFENGQPDKAVARLETGLVMIQERLGNRDPAIATMYNTLAAVYRSIGRLDRSSP
jgi:hypothetical protein